MNTDFFRMFDDLKLQGKVDEMNIAFPGESCGDTECENACANAFEIAKRIGVNPKNLIENRIETYFSCAKASSSFRADMFSNHCRFGFVKPDNPSMAIMKFDDGVEVKFIFHAEEKACKKCKSFDGKEFSEEIWNNEAEMKKAGLWKQKDGSYKPHPNCKCKWEKKETPIDYSPFDWKKISSGKLAVYTAEDLPGKPKSIPAVLKEKLAKKVDLDLAEFDKWAQNISYSDSKGKTTISVSTPNIWICADLLRGGSWYWDRPIVNWGGSIGQALSFLGTVGMHEITCRTVEELKAAFTKNPKAVWGFVLYAHGNKEGKIGPSDGSIKKGTAMSQNELMSLVGAQGFKLGKLYLMQCDSGSNGLFSVEYSYQQLLSMNKKILSSEEFEKLQKEPREKILDYYMKSYKKYYESIAKNTPHLEFKDCFIKADSIIILFYCEWGVAWGKHVVGGMPNVSYQGANAIGIDWGFLEKEPPQK